MYPASFDYHAPAALDEALALLDSLGENAKVIAGGQSLIPLMKLRFAAPDALVDINRIQGLDTLAEDPGGGLRIGALVRHKDCERSPLLKGRYGVLGDAARTTLFGPGRWNTDLALTKKAGKFQFRAEVFNIFNTAQFSAPGTVVGSPTFGVISSTVKSPRQVQLAVKFVF